MLISFTNVFMALVGVFKISAVVLAFLMLSPARGRADVTAEVTITDKSFPPSPSGANLAVYDVGDGGECTRSVKQIGSLVVRLSWPWDSSMVASKISELGPQILKAGTNAVFISEMVVQRFSPDGFPEEGYMVFSLVRFVDEPQLDLRSEADFEALFRSKGKLAPIEGIWVDQITGEKVAFFEDPKQLRHFIGVKFDNSKQPKLPRGLIVADMRMQPDGWLIGHVYSDACVRYPVKLKLPSGDAFTLVVKQCINGAATRSYPDIIPPKYKSLFFQYIRLTPK